MNWKRIIGAGSVVVAAVAVVFFAKTCSDQRVSDAIQESYKTIADTKQELVDVRRQNDSLRNIVEYRDSVAAPRDSVPVKKTAARDSGVIVVRHTTTPTVTRRAVASTKPVGGKTTVRMQENAKNNKNIIVPADATRGDEIEIVLGNGAVNDGNIIIGGDKIIVTSRDSLRNVIDTLHVKTR